MKFKKLIDTIKENLLDNDTCDECNQLLTDCDCEQKPEAEDKSTLKCNEKQDT